MNKKHCSLLTISILFACNAHSAGFQVAEHSASGLGRAFSGEGAVADNASVLARNPAAMTLFENTTFSGALSIVDPEVNVYDVDNKEQSDDVAPLQVVPASYYISPINDSWAWGIGLFTNYGVATDYPDDISAGDMAGHTSLLSVNLNPNIAYRINESFSVGAGVNLVYAEAELTRHKGETADFVGGQYSDRLIGMTGETFGYGWNVGALYELNENHRFAFGYRSAVKLDFDDGEFSSYDSGIATESKVTGRLKIDLPAIMELSAFHQLNEQWAVHYGWQRTDWSTFEELKATSPDCDDGVPGQCFYKPEKYEDNDRLSLGATYQLNADWTFRAGFAFDEQAGKATLSIPDSDRRWYSAGVTYMWSDNLSLDAGFALVVSSKGSFTEENALDQERTFEAEGTAYISAMQLNYTFK
ncbi:long-chain fatty acid outer membrane transporter [Vibrio variabilis]|uniref:Long-chain fatty acid outer membrane transporter n=1 Tax=Vibrio variabilis TaxID=990271 RepID=A0ABR4YH65_9VIBR|nr:outer membrane protein transport protein [Vibrio variabilis]KHA62245.1 long-chain fatty acid outer membrane transporter [Vibrio variabilis]